VCRTRIVQGFPAVVDSTWRLRARRMGSDDRVDACEPIRSGNEQKLAGCRFFSQNLHESSTSQQRRFPLGLKVGEVLEVEFG